MIDRRLIRFMGSSRKYIAFHVVFQLLSLLLNIAAVLALALTVQRLADGCLSRRFAATAAAVFGGALLLRLLCAFAAARMSFYAADGVRLRLREAVYGKLLRLGGTAKTRFTSGETVQTAMEGVDQLEIYFGRYLPQFFYSLAAPPVLFVVMAPVSLPAAVVLFLCVPLIPLSIVAVVKIAKRVLKKYWGSYGRLGETFLENVRGLTTLKIYKADERKSREMDEEAERFRVATMNVLKMQLNSIIVMDLIAYGGAAAGVILAVTGLLGGSVSLGGALILILLSAEFFIPLRMLGSLFHVAMNGLSASRRLFEILDTPEPHTGRDVLTGDEQSVRFDNVSFSYDGERTILDRFSLAVPGKGLYCLVGLSGCGKSTAASLLNGRCTGYDGSIFLGGRELSSLSPDSRYRHIVTVDHNAYLFRGTIRDNLRMADKTVTDSRITEVLREAGLPEWASFSGPEMKLEERAANLSGGQKQRLALARAVLADGAVYLFDEVTSGVDAESEEKMMKVIHRLAAAKPVFLITHRLYHCVEADRVFFLADGTVAAEGSHEELMKAGGPYADLFRRQAELESVLGKEEA